MKTLFVIFMAILGLDNNELNQDLPKLRNAYEQSAQDEKVAIQTLKAIQTQKQLTPVLQGYEAAITIVMAKHQFNPFSQLSYFNKGKEMLEKTITQNQNNTELLFLRFAIQCKAPGFLGYNTNIQADKVFLTQKIKTLSDQDLKRRIILFMQANPNI